MKLKLNTISFLKNVTNVLFTLTISQTIIAQNTNETVYCTFDTPRDSPMPNMYYRSYNTDPNFQGSITVIGKNGPDLSPYRKLDFAYQNGNLDVFFFQVQGGTFPKFDLLPFTTYAFDQANPELTLSNTGIPNFDGSYYVSLMKNDKGPDFQDFIMVSKTGDFTIYFSYSESAPTCVENIIENVFEDIVYDENVNGNLSLDNNTPTVITLSPGNNRIISTQTQTVDQANYFTFQVPQGYELSQLIVDNYEGSDDIGFIGINDDSFITTAPPVFIGGLSYGTANIGTDILPAMGDASNPAASFISGFGFTPPLATKQYTVWLNQTGSNSTSVLNFVISAEDSTLSVIDNEIKNNVVLKQNYPNPFKSTTTIEFNLRKKSDVSLEIYTLQGQLIKSLNSGVQSVGKHQLTFDLNEMSNGVYLSVLLTDNGSQKQLIVLNR